MATQDTVTQLISAIRRVRRVAAIKLLRLFNLGLDHDRGLRST